MRIDILSLFPKMFEGFLNDSIIKRAVNKGIVEIHLHNIRDYSLERFQKVDDKPFGGGSGMVLQCEPIVRCLEALKEERTYDEIIFMSPDGSLLNQSICNELSLKGNLILIAGRYKGIDQRIRDHWVTREISIGEYVLTGGELPAAVLSDAIIRLIPGVLHDETSALSDSFQGELLDSPVYTQPANFRGFSVPNVLLSGNHKLIDEWKYEESLKKMDKKSKDE